MAPPKKKDEEAPEAAPLAANGEPQDDAQPTEKADASSKAPTPKRKSRAAAERAGEKGAARSQAAADASDAQVAEGRAADEAAKETKSDTDAQAAAAEASAVKTPAKRAPRRKRASKQAQAEQEAAAESKSQPAPQKPSAQAQQAEPQQTQATSKRRKRSGAESSETAKAAKTPAPQSGKQAPSEVSLRVVQAKARYVRTSARKARIVCGSLRGKSVAEARAILAFTPRAAARDWSKVLESAVANAENNHELVEEDLVVREAYADEGPTIKRFRPRARGRAAPILKRTSHLTITLTSRR